MQIIYLNVWSLLALCTVEFQENSNSRATYGHPLSYPLQMSQVRVHHTLCSHQIVILEREGPQLKSFNHRLERSSTRGRGFHAQHRKGKEPLA